MESIFVDSLLTALYCFNRLQWLAKHRGKFGKGSLSCLCGRWRTFDLRYGQMVFIDTMNLVGYGLFVENLAEAFHVFGYLRHLHQRDPKEDE